MGDGTHGVTVQGERREGLLQEDQRETLLLRVPVIHEALVGPGVDEDRHGESLLLPGESGGKLGGVKTGKGD